MKFQHAIRVTVLPELRRFLTPQDAARAMHRAGIEVFTTLYGLVACVGIVIVGGVAMSFPILLAYVYGVPSLPLWVQMVVSMVGGAVLGFAPFVFLKRRFNRSLWRQLAEQGIACCIMCGYNLTGNVSGVCPECGTKIELRTSNGN